MYDNVHGLSLLEKLNEDSEKEISLALDTDPLTEFLKYYAAEPETYYVSGYVFKFVPLVYGNGKEFFCVAPVHAEKEVVPKRKDPTKERGKIKYSFLSLVSGPSRFSIENIIQDAAPEVGMLRVLTHRYVLPMDERKTGEAFAAIMEQAALAADGEKSEIGTTNRLAKLLNIYVAKPDYGRIQPINPVITKETAQFPRI
jgi:hypothetical protein